MNYIKKNINFLLILFIYLFAIASKCGSSGTNDKKSSNKNSSPDVQPISSQKAPVKDTSSTLLKDVSQLTNGQENIGAAEKTESINNQIATPSQSANTGRNCQNDQGNNQDNNNNAQLFEKAKETYECTQSLLNDVKKALENEQKYLQSEDLKSRISGFSSKTVQEQKNLETKKRKNKFDPLQKVSEEKKEAINKAIQEIENKEADTQTKELITKAQNNVTQIEETLNAIQDEINKIQNITPNRNKPKKNNK